ncbi:hypothetical protein C8R43DRAFT_976219 [Mycena crocata]|nr:hypothetical protein C8R43DRAFT_976219 [Mycena crocata]
MDSYDWDSIFRFDQLEAPTATSQLPTPPYDAEDKEALVSISTTFFPAARRHDLILLSSDSVRFYVDSERLRDASENQFGDILPISSVERDGPAMLDISQPAAVLNIILHAIYDMTCAQYSPAFEILVNAVDSMPIYGIKPKTIIRPATALFTLLLSQAPLFPVELYTLAARYDIVDLAVPASSHMLAYPLSRLTDEVVEKMGASYLKRLFFLHFGRAEALKRVLQSPPHPHPPTDDCDFASQKGVSRAWALASAYLGWDIRPDISTATIESALNPLGEHLSCHLCKQTLSNRVRDVVVQWALVKRTI